MAHLIITVAEVVQNNDDLNAYDFHGQVQGNTTAGRSWPFVATVPFTVKAHQLNQAINAAAIAAFETNEAPLTVSSTDTVMLFGGGVEIN